MRFLMILGGTIAILSLAAYFGFVLPKLENIQSQSMLLGPMAMFAGPEVQAELQAHIDAINLARMITIMGAIIGGVFFTIGLLRRKQPKEHASK